MTHPNLLRLGRSCAKWMTGILLVACLGLSTSCKPTKKADAAEAPASGEVIGPVGAVSPRDSLTYTLSWPAGPRSTSYLTWVRASATNGSWSGLPVAQPTTGRALTFTAHAIPWDSATFTWVTKGQNANGVSPDSLVVVWRVKRLPGAPPAGTVDSSLAASSVILLPNPIAMVVGEERAACAFQVFPSGHVGMKGGRDAVWCDSIYQRTTTAAQRALTAGEQFFTDTACWSWSSSNPAAAWPGQIDTCSGAANIHAIGLTQRPVDPFFRFAAAPVDNSPVASVDQHGRATCLRPGQARITATVDGVEQVFLLNCLDRAGALARR